MKCIACDSYIGATVFRYDEPDKYEKWMGLGHIKRAWKKCECGMYQQDRNYPVEFLEKIYEDGYRDVDFRKDALMPYLTMRT